METKRTALIIHCHYNYFISVFNWYYLWAAKHCCIHPSRSCSCTTAVAHHCFGNLKVLCTIDSKIMLNLHLSDAENFINFAILSDNFSFTLEDTYTVQYSSTTLPCVTWLTRCPDRSLPPPWGVSAGPCSLRGSLPNGWTWKTKSTLEKSKEKTRLLYRGLSPKLILITTS